MDTTMLLTSEVELPSGATAKIREMTGREEDLFANENIVKSGQIGARILGNVVLELNGEKPTSHTVADMWSADRSAALLHARVLTFGEEIRGEVECRNDSCEVGIAIHVDNLLEDLEVTPRPEEFEKTVELPGGLVARVRPGKGIDEERLAQAQKKGEMITELLFSRTVEISGIESRQELRRFLAEGSLRIRRALQKEITNMEFGIETGLEVTCPVCGTEQTVDVQSLPSFFFPESDDL